MSGSISVSPYTTSQPQDSFLLQTQGYIQGAASDDPSSRMWLSGGTLLSTETLPMWGGVPINEYVNLMGVNSEGLGNKVLRAVSTATTVGWSVTNQAMSMIIGAGNAVPVAGAGPSGGTGNYVSYFRNGTNIRIAVPVTAALVTAATATTSTTGIPLYWNATTYNLDTSVGGTFALPTTYKLLSINTNSKIVSYSSGTGLATWTTGSCALLMI